MPGIRDESYWAAFLVPLETTLHRIVSFVPRLLVAFVVFLLCYGMATLGRHLKRKALERVPHIPWAVRILIARGVYILTVAVGLLLALAVANIDVTTLLTSLGVAGFAIGFALKDILENFISGILLLFARPFEVGDQVTLGNFEGTVTDIQIRTTTLCTYNEEVVTIPNSIVYTNPVVNHTRHGQRRYSVCFDTSLKADLDTVQREALAAVSSNHDIAPEPRPFVRLERISSGTDTLTWHVYYWAESTKAMEIRLASETIERIKRGLFDAGVSAPTTVTVFQGVAPANAAPPDGATSLDGAASPAGAASPDGAASPAGAAVPSPVGPAVGSR